MTLIDNSIFLIQNSLLSEFLKIFDVQDPLFIRFKTYNEM